MLGPVTQHPQEILRYEIDYSRWLDTENGEALSGVSVSVNPTGTSPDLIATGEISVDQQSVIVVISAGEAGKDYSVNILATTTFNQKDHECIGVKIRETC